MLGLGSQNALLLSFDGLVFPKATSSCDFKTSLRSSRISPSTIHAMAHGNSEASSTILEWKSILQLGIVPFLFGAKRSA